MPPSIRTIALATVLAITPALAAATDRPTLERPGNSFYAYDEHTPSSRLMSDAQRAYRARMYSSALSTYKAAARWSDKFAQYNIGMMHLRGEGTEYDPLRGWAWLELSAERGYPQFQEAADALWRLFDDAERDRARAILENDLLPVYGDEVTLERTAREMRFRQRDATGSRTGSLGMLQMLRVIDASGFTRDGTEFYDPEKWDFQNIVRYETDLMIAIHGGTVELQELELDDDPPSDPE